MNNAYGLKPLVLGLAAAAMTFAWGMPEDADAQSGRVRRAQQRAQPAAAAGPQLDRARGALEAPAALQAAKVACTIADAAYIGTATTTENGVAVPRIGYEVACQEGLGYVIYTAVAPAAAAPQAVDCLALQGLAQAAAAAAQPGAPAAARPLCRLPGNAQPAQGLRNLVAQAGAACTIANARYVGKLTASGATRYEVGCSEGQGFFLDRPEGSARPVTTSCLSALDSTAPCQFTPRAQVLATLAPVVARSGRQCTVADARLAGRNPTTRGDVVEIGCQGRPGFFVELDNAGQFARALDCGTVSNTPCKFTDPVQQKATMIADYTARLRGSGYDCNVSDFRRLGTETRTSRDIVEVACSNRPDGAITVLGPVGQRAEIYDCLRAGRFGTTCSLTQPSVLYPALSTGIGTRAPRGCQVSNARSMGFTPQGEHWLEVLCADGRSFAIDFRGSGRVQQVLTCRDAQDVLGGCRAGVSASVPRD